MNNKEEIPTIILRVKSHTNPNGGGFVAEFRCLAAALMTPRPKVVTWGNRTFVYRDTQTQNGNLIYVEELGYPLVEGMTCEKV